MQLEKVTTCGNLQQNSYNKSTLDIFWEKKKSKLNIN